jgi:hypothetical protein
MEEDAEDDYFKDAGFSDDSQNKKKDGMTED